MPSITAPISKTSGTPLIRAIATHTAITITMSFIVSFLSENEFVSIQTEIGSSPVPSQTGQVFSGYTWFGGRPVPLQAGQVDGWGLRRN